MKLCKKCKVEIAYLRKYWKWNWHTWEKVLALFYRNVPFSEIDNIVWDNKNDRYPVSVVWGIRLSLIYPLSKTTREQMKAATYLSPGVSDWMAVRRRHSRGLHSRSLSLSHSLSPSHTIEYPFAHPSEHRSFRLIRETTRASPKSKPSIHLDIWNPQYF